MNPYDRIGLDLIKPTPVVLIELYNDRDPCYIHHPEERRRIYAEPNRGYMRLYLSDGEVLQFHLPEVEFCMIPDQVLEERRREKEGGRLPWNTLPDVIYYTNSARQVVAYLVDEACRVEGHHAVKEVSRSFAARHPTRYPQRIARH